MVATTSPKVHMGTITAGEARELYSANPVVLLPMGSHEDQGPHAAMGDYLLAERIAELAALRATASGTRTVVAPVLPFGGADFFGPMIGAIALTEATLAAVLGEMVAQLHRHGLTRLVVLNGHGGNVGPIATVAREVHRRTGMLIPSLYLWRIAKGMLAEVVGEDVARRSGGHGADPLASIGLHLAPEMMRTDMMPGARPLKRDAALDLAYRDLGLAEFEGAEVGLPTEYDAVYNDGVGVGDPMLCSAAAGAALTERLTGLVARFAAHFAARAG